MGYTLIRHNDNMGAFFIILTNITHPVVRSVGSVLPTCAEPPIWNPLEFVACSLALPSPNCPWLLVPHKYAVPDDVSTTVCDEPQDNLKNKTHDSFTRNDLCANFRSISFDSQKLVDSYFSDYKITRMTHFQNHENDSFSKSWEWPMRVPQNTTTSRRYSVNRNVRYGSHSMADSEPQ